MKKLKISVITPCFNEEKNVVECAYQLQKVMKDQLSNYEYEHIFSDNCSLDSTKDLIKKLAVENKRVKLIVNSRNVGPFRNIWNAMKSATGDLIIPMLPADLQDPPFMIPKMVELWEQGNFVIYGIRANRQESFFMRGIRNLYYKLIRKFSWINIPEHAGEFLLADKRVIDSILKTDSEYPYIRGLIAQTGVKSANVVYDWGKRKNGSSRNTFLNLVDQGINGFISTSRIPARLALALGFALSICGIFAAFTTLLIFILSPGEISPGIPTLIVSVFFFGGINLFFLGIIGEYVLSIHSQVRRPPTLFETERINF
jgi:glycosyltransferase involved in cell wall biosynthesis